MILSFEMLKEDILRAYRLICAGSRQVEGLSIDLLGVKVRHLRTGGVILAFEVSLELV